LTNTNLFEEAAHRTAIWSCLESYQCERAASPLIESFTLLIVMN